MKKQIVIVSPALADANNGNWQTARRWQKLLQPQCSVRIVQQWPDGPKAAHDLCMLALHARKSAESIAAWVQAHGDASGLAVVLTGTDLYRDIQTDLQAQQSLQLARRLVVLQECGPAALPEEFRARTTVIFQSTSPRVTVPKPVRLRAVMVGHLRDEKSPQTLFAAAQLLRAQDEILLDHIGAPLDPVLADQARATAAACAHYRWLGALPHATTRRRIQHAHLLVHTSRMEGGAHVVMEAVRSGTPVLASRVDGNVGMLGADYAGYFEWDNAQQLVDLLRRCRHNSALYLQLQAQCAARAPLFSAEAERQALLQLVHTLF